MMYCPKCGSQNPDGSRFCGTCGMTFAAAPTPQPVPGPGPRPVPGPTPGLRPTSGGFGLFTIISVVAVLIAAVLLLLPSVTEEGADIYGSGVELTTTIPGYSALLGPFANEANDQLSEETGLSRKEEGAIGSFGMASFANTLVFPLWVISIAATAIAVFDAVKSKTPGSIPLIVAGFACALTALLWIIAVGNFVAGLDAISEADGGVSWTVWVALFAGLAAGVVALLEKLGILRD